MITIRELTRKCNIHNTPLASRPVDGTKGQLVGRLYWCPLCDTKTAEPIPVTQEVADMIANRADHMKAAPVRQQER